MKLRIPFNEAVSDDVKYSPAKVGDKFGRSWSTHWFKVNITIPAKFAGQEVHLLWDSESEAMGRIELVFVCFNSISFYLIHLIQPIFCEHSVAEWRTYPRLQWK